MLPRDNEAVKDASIDTRVIRRAWTFAHPFKWRIVGFVVSIVVAAVIALLPPLIFRAIIDNAIPAKDTKQIWVLTGFAVLVALADAGLAIVQRWYSARIGEGLIYELRVALFDKVQRMPVAFFTRTQTGALISRLNNDVVGAQTAVTSTLGSVVSNVIVLATTLPLMLFLQWKLTILTLIVLPLFIIPARRVGRRLAEIAREQMNLNSRLNTQMTERFNVSGAMLVKLFGRLGDEHDEFSGRAARVRDNGIRSAMYGRVFFVALGVVAALGRGDDLRRRRADGGERDDRDRHAGGHGRLHRAHLPAAHRADQRPGRPDELAGQLRAGVRGARRAGVDHRQALGRGSRAPDGTDRVRPRVVPLPAGRRGHDRARSRSPAPKGRTRTAWCSWTST